MTTHNKHHPSVPRDRKNNYTETLTKQRRDFVSQQSEQSMQHIAHYSVFIFEDARQSTSNG
ncbi:MAG: hypothetical protein ACJAV1_001515 [Paraglaciecola sp.]|jgi:hypothetical protein